MGKIIIAGTKSGDVVEKDIETITLETLQEAVDGYIEVAPLYDLKDFDIITLVNEEGLLSGLDPNENLFPFFYVGNVVFVSVDGEDFTPLNDLQVKTVREYLKHLNKHSRTDES